MFLLYGDISKSANVESSRFDCLSGGVSSINYVDSIGLCDYVVLPYKWRGMDDSTAQILADCKENNKRLLVFLNSDYNDDVNLSPAEAFIFKTGLYKGTKKPNEHEFPAFVDDRFGGEHSKGDCSIGFCGDANQHRLAGVNSLKADGRIVCDFTMRDVFWGHAQNQTFRDEFFSNLKNNTFGFCCRGSGNFSFRFYEILSMGRIPVLLSTDSVLPFDDHIGYEECCIIVNMSEVSTLGDRVHKFYTENKESIKHIQTKCREVYDRFLSPLGYSNTISRFLEARIKT